jgi:hypothetical protein
MGDKTLHKAHLAKVQHLNNKGVPDHWLVVEQELNGVSGNPITAFFASLIAGGVGQ